MNVVRAAVICSIMLVAAAALAEPVRMDLPALLVRARQAPPVAVARARARGAEAKADEVAGMWIPQLELSALAGPGPKIECVPSEDDCARTEPTNVALNFSGVFWRIDARVFMPVYTFGKLSAGKRAAEAGADAHEALVQAAAADAELDAARAYYGLKLARELILMLEEGRGNVETAITRVEKALDKGGGDVTETDRYRLKTFRAEVDARMAEARRIERIALAGVRLFAGTEDADIDVAPLDPVVEELPTEATVRADATSGRPERRAALFGAKAARELAVVEERRWWPDLVAGLQATFAQATGADDPSNVFANDPFNVSSVTGGLFLRWVLEPGTRPAKVRGARAEAARAEATAELARTGVALEASKVWAEATDAKARLEASRMGEKDARAWLVSTLQATSAGLAEPKELADALLAWFNMRARVLQSIYDWNVAVFALKRATGKLLVR